MMPGMYANLVSQNHVNKTARGLSRELARFVRWEYAGDGATVRAAIARSSRVRQARKELGIGRAVLRVLAKIEDGLAAAFATPGGA